MRVFLVAACAATLYPTLAAAEAGHVLSEAVFLALLGSDHPALIAEREELLEAEAEAAAARVFEVPDLEGTYESPGRVEQVDLGVSWQLPHPGRRRLAAQATSARVSAARSRFETEAAALHQTLRAVYARWSISTAKAGALERWAGELDDLAEREQRRAVEGESSGLDARRLTLAALEARARLAQAEAERLEAFAAVRAWYPLLEEASVPELPPLPPPATTPAAAHPDLVALEAELAAAATERELAGLLADMPALAAGWQRQESDGLTAEGPTLAVRWALPLAGRRERSRALAEAAISSTTARLEVRRRELDALREGARAAYEGLRQAALDNRSVTADNHLVREAALAAFEAGEVDVTDLLDALRSVVEAEVAVLELHRQAAAAHRLLQQTSGPALP